MGHHSHRTDRLHHDLDLDMTHDLDPRKSRTLPKYLTRLLFVTLLTTGSALLGVSVLLLMQCRESVKEVEDVVDHTHALCSPFPLPAYYACAIILITIFGMGCVGRRVTGCLLITASMVTLLTSIIMVWTKECPDDEIKIQQTLAIKLRQCGLFKSLHNLKNNDFHSMALLQVHNPSYSHYCDDIVSSLTTLCRYDLIDSSSDTRQTMGRFMNETGVEACARNISASMHELCMEDAEIVYPLLMTLPVFYFGIGIALKCIKTNDVPSKPRYSINTLTHTASVGTNTPHPASSSHPGSSAAHVLCACLSALCVRHSLCFTCLLRGNACDCCSSSSPLPPLSSRQTFQLTDMVGEGGGKEEGNEGESALILKISLGSQENVEMVDESL